MRFILSAAPELVGFASWLLTLLAHSVVCCAAALAAGRWLVRDPRADLNGLIVVGTFSALVVAGASVSLLRFTRRRRLAWKAISKRRILSGDSHDWTSIPTFVRLSLSAEISSPIALTRNEICLPSGIFPLLTSAQRRSILAHEVAHLERRDPEWMLLGQLIAGAMVLQPLCRLVVERMRRDSEFICDDKAVTGQASSRALAESLAILARPFDSLATATLGSHYSSSPIVERAERLLGSQTRIAALRQPRRGRADEREVVLNSRSLGSRR